MTAKIEELKIINWKINLKNGASVDLNVKDGDGFDKSLSEWVDSISKRGRSFFHGAFEQGQIWLAPSEFAMAVRTPYRPPATQEEKFTQIGDKPPILV
jgi:hypothetical protein